MQRVFDDESRHRRYSPRPDGLRTRSPKPDFEVRLLAGRQRAVQAQIAGHLTGNEETEGAIPSGGSGRMQDGLHWLIAKARGGSKPPNAPSGA